MKRDLNNSFVKEYRNIIKINKNIFLISLLRNFNNSLKKTLKLLLKRKFINYENISELIEFILKKTRNFNNLIISGCDLKRDFIII